MVSDYPWGTTETYTRANLFQFNIFINDLLLFIKETDICKLVDNTAVYACGKDLDAISSKLQLETNTAIKWLKDNKMVASTSKFNLCFFQKTKQWKNIPLDGKTIKSSDSVELLGITLDKNINFKWHTKYLSQIK